MPHLNIQTRVLLYNSKYLQMWVAQVEHGKMISLKREHMECLKHATYREGDRAF